MAASAMEERNEKPPPLEESDHICDAIGGFGRWQLKLTFLLSLVNIPCTWHIFVPTFQAPATDDFWCARPSALNTLPSDLWINISHPYILDKVSDLVGTIQEHSVGYSFYDVLIHRLSQGKLTARTA